MKGLSIILIAFLIVIPAYAYTYQVNKNEVSSFCESKMEGQRNNWFPAEVTYSAVGVALIALVAAAVLINRDNRSRS